MFLIPLLSAAVIVLAPGLSFAQGYIEYTRANVVLL
jgi:hypothetical protein